MLCFSMSGASFSQKVTNSDNENDTFVTTQKHTQLSTQEMTNMVESSVNKYLTTSQQNYEPINYVEEPIELPWMQKSNADLLEWWIRLEYKGNLYDQKVEISIQDFNEKFLKHPEYGEKLYFDIDSDPADDVEVIVGFYWSDIKYPDGQDARSLEFRYRIRQMPNGGIADSDAELQVWSELRVNYGLIANPSGGKSKDITFKDKIENFFERFINNKHSRFPLIKTLIERFADRFTTKTNDFQLDTLSTVNDDADYISIGSGYKSAAGERIPLLVEKRFSFGIVFPMRHPEHLLNCCT